MAETTTQPTFFERNKKTILVVGFLVLATLLFAPDAYIRKYVPWVK